MSGRHAGTRPPRPGRRRRTTRGERRGRVGAVTAAAVGVLLLAIGTPAALGGLSVTLGNTTDTARSAVFPCSAAAIAASAYFAYPYNESSGTSATDVTDNARTGTYGPSGITYGASGPCPKDGGRAITLDGSSGYATTRSTMVGPNTFSVEIWFRTTTTTGGKLIGFGSSQTGSSSNYDRHLYMTNAGTITFGVYPNAVRTVTSAKAYNDGAWHQVVGTLAPTTDANPGLRLYVDGALVASDATVLSAQSFTGYWRIGYDNLSGWTAPPSSYYFKGSLAWAQLYLSALTPSQVSAQYAAGS